MAEEQRKPRGRRKFSDEFKRGAVELVRGTGGPVAQVAGRAGDLRLDVGQLLKQDRIDRGEREGLTSEDRARLRQLEADNARLRMEPDLLKRSVAFWCRRRRHG